MSVINVFKPIYKANAVRNILAVLFAIFIFDGCAFPFKETESSKVSTQYNVDTMAKDWRSQVRKNIPNPYEQFNLPADNDSDYKAPKNTKKKAKTSVQYPVDNNDSSYGKFPRYNPDDDNLYLDPKNYPLYMD